MVELGAQTLGYLQKHLILFLTAPPSSISWVLSFSERHCSVYGASSAEGGVNLVIQDAEAKKMGEFRLTDPERRTWVELLEKR
jgi:hypothetical protein